MATKSILKTVHIKSSKSARRLASALENAAGKHGQEVQITRPASDATRDEIRKMFGSKK